MTNSIGAIVQARNSEGKQFALASGKHARGVHQFPIKVIVVAHHRGVERVDLDDVIRIRDSLFRRQLI